MLLQLALAGALAAVPPPPTSGDTLTTPPAAPPIFRVDPRPLAASSGAPPADPFAPLFPPAAPLPRLAPIPALASARTPEPVPMLSFAGRRDADPDDTPQLIEYSDAYFTRLTVHRWASYLMLPLFVSDFIVGQKLINGTGGGNLRGVHGALGAGIAGLFAVNTVTGGMNMIEGWQDPEGRTRRTIHSALMLLADIGFVATAALAREREDEGGVVSSPVSNNTHRAVAIASMSTAVIGYSIMLPIFGRD